MTRQLVFKLDEKEAVDALKAHYRLNTLTGRVFLRLFLLWLVCTLLFSGILIAIEGENWFHYWGNALFKIAGVYAMIILAIWALNYFVFIPHTARRVVKGDKQIGLQQTWIWDDQAVAIRSSYIKGTYPFRLFYNWREYPEFIALYISAQKFNILPKHVMTDEQLDDLRTIFTREIIRRDKR
ncbi:YcxB family protein [Bartonella sp. LJL80]